MAVPFGFRDEPTNIFESNTMRRKRNAAQQQHPDQMQHDTGGHSGHHSARKAHYKGFEIEVETHYKFSIDGKPLEVHAHVLDSGHVHSPSLPNYGWASALDFVRQLIDSFPDDFQPQRNTKSSKKSSATMNSTSEKISPKKPTLSRQKSTRQKSKGKSSGRKKSRRS